LNSARKSRISAQTPPSLPAGPSESANESAPSKNSRSLLRRLVEAAKRAWYKWLCCRRWYLLDTLAIRKLVRDLVVARAQDLFSVGRHLFHGAFVGSSAPGGFAQPQHRSTSPGMLRVSIAANANVRCRMAEFHIQDKGATSRYTYAAMPSATRDGIGAPLSGKRTLGRHR